MRRAAAADLDLASDVLGVAFADYAWTRWTVDPDEHVARVTALQRLVMEAIAIPYGEVWIADDASVAIWMPPDAAVPASAWDAIAGETARLEGSRHDASRAAEAVLAGVRPRTPHWFLGAVGTRPDAQHRGLGTAVLAPVLARCGDDTTHAYLETSAPDNVGFYASLGFAVIGELAIPDDGPHVWQMRR